MNGSVHIWPIMAVNVNSPKISARQVTPSMVKMWDTVIRITSRFVLKVSKPRPASDKVRHCVGVVIGVWKVRPRMYKGQRS